MKPRQGLDEVLEEFERNPLGLPERELRRMEQSSRRLERFVMMATVSMLSFFAGIFVATHPWGEVLWSVGSLAAVGGFLMWRFRKG